MEFNEKTVGYILYAVGIIGGVEGATDVRPELSLVISIVSVIVIIIASYLLAKNNTFFNILIFFQASGNVNNRTFSKGIFVTRPRNELRWHQEDAQRFCIPVC